MNAAVRLEAWDGAMPASVGTVRGEKAVATEADRADPAFLRDWEGLAEDASEANPFYERWFLAPGLRLLATSDVRLLAVRSGGRLIGVMPLVGSRGYARLPVHFATNWLHYHAFLGTPLVVRGKEQAFWAAALAFVDATPGAGSFLHLTHLVEGGPVLAGLEAVCRSEGRDFARVHRSERALIRTDLEATAYYEATVRKKKRKEIGRLSKRLADEGAVRPRVLEDGTELTAWCDAFLALERSGWKGEAGSALGSSAATDAFFREAAAAAFARGKLDFLALELEGRAIAMLATFLAGEGGFSYKIAHDEAFARYSPGVLLQIENYATLGRRRLAWMDSCAVENHSMIDSLWAERRPLVRVSVRLKGRARGAAYALCRLAEVGAAEAKKRLSKAEAKSD